MLEPDVASGPPSLNDVRRWSTWDYAS